MNLEKIEEKCLHYLAQASNPLVPIDTLLAYCQRDPDCGKLDRQELLDFLRPHAQFQVMEGLEMGSAIDPETFKAAGIHMGQRAILKSRVPSKDEITEMLFGQLKDMTDVLVASLNQAKAAKDEERVEQLEEALKKSEALRAKMNNLL